jgi:ABC-2 type transport system permease protein
MSAAVVLATAGRILRQLRNDPRTVGLLLLVPVLLLTLLRYVYGTRPAVFDAVGGPLLALFPFITMFLVTSVAMLRERATGTLERLLTMPMRRSDLLLGYAAAFGAAAVVQTALASAVAFGLLGLDVTGSRGLVVLLAVLDALLGTALGLLMSAFARTEFQAVQFLPAVVLPQLLLCGLLAPRSTMAQPLRWLSDVLPLTYAVDGMQVLARESASGAVARDVAVVSGASVLSLALAAASLRRRTS